MIGLGIIGAVWAQNLQKDGIEVKAWNRTRKDFPGFEPDLAKAVKGSDIIIIVVADPPAVQQVLDVILPVLRQGQTIVQSSTISTKWTLKFAQQVRKTGARYLEAPFTGSKPAAEQRKTVFYLGGEKADIDAANPILERISAHRIHIGPTGSASALKLAMNMNIAMVFEGLSESLNFARSQGISDDMFFEALHLNVARSGLSDLKEEKLRKGDYSPQFSLKHMDKDLRLAIEDAGDLRLPQLRETKKIYDEGMSKNLGDKDFSVLSTLLK
jgi:3-hydroxyisobutyrate dehydrogenase-like beta-hydroxyacid dehydrogenase